MRTFWSVLAVVVFFNALRRAVRTTDNPRAAELRNRTYAYETCTVPACVMLLLCGSHASLL
jgi:hypothetical protein